MLSDQGKVIGGHVPRVPSPGASMEAAAKPGGQENAWAKVHMLSVNLLFCTYRRGQEEQRASSCRDLFLTEDQVDLPSSEISAAFIPKLILVKLQGQQKTDGQHMNRMLSVTGAFEKIG